MPQISFLHPPGREWSDGESRRSVRCLYYEPALYDYSFICKSPAEETEPETVTGTGIIFQR